ncbi:MAG: hypothetical protein QME60_05750 [Verrucomicrobiota bacterium]|nr:hypothetical protein [Verrucomicrobiota bacterium]
MNDMPGRWLLAGWLAVASAGAAPADGRPEIAADRMMLAPFSAQRASFFHAALGVPRMDSAAIPLLEGET